MVKRYIKLCLVVVILQFSTVKASAQIGSVIGIASKYASLLKSNQNNIIYASESLEEIKDDHEKIAILPFQAQIEYTKPPEYDVEEAQAQFENQQMIGKMLQEQFWDVFDNNRSDVFLQDIRITNKILQDIGYFANPEQFPPSYLAKLLEVDAVLICTYDIKVDNEKTGWQSFSKAFTSFAVSNLKGMVPGLEALSFVKNPQAIIDIVTKPKEFFDKLKSGDLSALASIANTMLPDGNISKVANLAAKNSKTIVNVAKGNTQNLFSDIISNNLEVIGKDLKINPQVMTMIKKNAGSVEKVMAGKTKGLIFDIVNNNIADVTSKYVSDQNNLLSQVISNNTTTLAKLAQGETKGLLSEIISNNLNQVSNLTGIENANQYTELLVKNKDIVTKLTSGNVLDLTQSLVLNNSEILGSQLNDTEKNNFSKLLSNPSMLSSLISGDVEDITSELLSNSSAIFDGAVGDKEISKYSKILTENKSLLAAISSNDKKGFLENILSKKSDWLGSGLQSNEISMISELLASNGQSIGNALNGNAPGLLSNVMASFDSNLKSDQLNPLSTLLLNDPEGLSALLKGDKNTLKSKLGDSEIPNLDSTLDTVLKNKGKLNHLLGLSPDKNFDILSKSPEELQVLSYNITNDSGVLSGVVAGDAATIANNFEKHNYDLDPELVQQLSNSLVKEKSNISQVVVNSTINQMLLNDEIDIQFFDFGPEALLEKYENVSLREKSFSQTAASILDPTTDPRDYTKLTINIFGKESDEILWQYINENTKTRLYDLNRTVAKVIDRVNKNFPYFIR